METPTQAQSSLPNPLPNLSLLALVLGNVTRWKLLKELTHGEPRSLTELSKICGAGYASTSRHLMLMRKLGLVVQGRGRLYQVPAQFLPQPGTPLLECGHCLLRLDAVS